jgi:hypothetical protein
VDGIIIITRSAAAVVIKESTGGRMSKILLSD